MLSTSRRPAQSFVVAISLLALPVAAVSDSSAATPGHVEPLVTNKPIFSIPFFLKQGANRPTHVYLFVSGNQGDRWDLYQKRAADDRRFDFQAGEDGTYWFVVRTTPKAVPNADTKPEKIVVVDRSKPALEMQVNLSQRGDVTAVWQANDAHLDPASFQLEYRGPTNSWQRVVAPPNSQQPGQPFTGHVEWSLASGVRQIEVRATIQDRAGNAAELRRQLSSPGPSGPTTAGDVDQSPANQQPPAAPADNSNPQPTKPPAYSTHKAPIIDKQSNSDRYSQWRSLGTANRSTAAANRDAPPFGQKSSSGRANLSATRLFETPGSSMSRSQHASQVAPPPENNGPAQSLNRQPYQPPVASRQSNASASSATSQQELPALPSTAEPIPENHGMSKSSRFHLDYDLEGVQLSDVLRVALYVTEDNGRSWREYGTDADRQSPFEVDTGREGVFGFRLLIHNQAGYAARPPQPGDQPDMTVVVDMTQPRVELFEAEKSEGDRRSINIRWQASDRFMRPKPVQISFAHQPDGPWSVVATNLENTGHYTWTPGFPLPPQLFLRVEVRDRAGNVGTAQSQRPIGNTETPVGIIRRVRPIE